MGPLPLLPRRPFFWRKLGGACCGTGAVSGDRPVVDCARTGGGVEQKKTNNSDYTCRAPASSGPSLATIYEMQAYAIAAQDLHSPLVVSRNTLELDDMTAGLGGDGGWGGAHKSSRVFIPFALVWRNVT